MFHWSLYEIDHTDIESLIPFVFRYGQRERGKPGGPAKVYADQVDWL